MRKTPDQQISLTDPDARSMATSGRWIGYSRRQCPGRSGHRTPSDCYARGHNVGSDRGQLSRMSKQAKEVLEVDNESHRSRAAAVGGVFYLKSRPHVVFWPEIEEIRKAA